MPGRTMTSKNTVGNKKHTQKNNHLKHKIGQSNTRYVHQAGRCLEQSASVIVPEKNMISVWYIKWAGTIYPDHTTRLALPITVANKRYS